VLFFIIVFFVSSDVFSQSGFRFYGSNTDKQQINFKLINNLIIIPLEINGKRMSFILDTGLSKTILFHVNKKDSLDLKNIEKVTLQGLGSGKPIYALVSKHNRFKIKNLISNDEDLHIVLNDKLDLSSKMGITIHGIIGYNLFRSAIVKVNYKTKRITFYNPKTFSYKKCKKCETFPLQFYRKKPYISMKVQLDTVFNKNTHVKMLVDTGGSDAIWLFEHTKKEIVTPKRFFKDVLGEGLNGTIYGNRSRIPAIFLGRFTIKKPTVSFLDSISTFNARKIEGRNGSIGSSVLKRFKVWIDYPNRKMTLKKNGSFSSDFNYNMSGLEIVYNGKVLVQERGVTSVDSYGTKGEKNNTISFVTNYYYKFKPSYRINRVTKGSSADLVGLLKGDILVRLNGKQAHTYELSRIVSLCQEREGKKIRLIVDRNGEKLHFEFRLKKKI